MNTQSPHTSAVFGLWWSLPPLVGCGGRLVCELVGTDDLLSYHSFLTASGKGLVELEPY